jgi:Carboxypeptidase regulatory-like domain
MRRVIFIAAMMLAPALTTFALMAFGQSANQGESPKSSARAGSITGRIVNESGKPMPNARVFVSGSGPQSVRRMINTDEAGRFVADDLPRGSYAITAQVSGYVLVRDPGDTVHHKPGDSVNLVLRKGAAITGTVTNSDGDPVVGVQMSATLVRDEQGRRNESTFGSSRYTDDRGVYRLFGLPGGTYIVAAASKTVGSVLTAYGDDAPTYYPSSTRDTAGEVTVGYGAEATGIDIRYRGEHGYAISGLIADASMSDSLNVNVSVVLVRASNDTLEAQTSIQPRGSQLPFSFYGVPDGDFYLTARRAPYQSDDGAASKRVPIKVRGRDVTGVGISLVPLGSIAGRLSLDTATSDLKCETRLTPAVEETLISVSTDDTDGSDPSSRFASIVYTPDNKGNFVFQGLPAARYRVDSRLLLDEAWYIRAMTVPGPTTTPLDASSGGIVVRPGQRINGVRLVLGEGAASIRGRVVTDKEGASLPDRLRVHLTPAEPNAAEDTLRFIEAEVQIDGSFKLANVAPGRYWLLARQLPEEDSKQRLPRPQAWNAATRAGLRREAVASNIAIDLKPCQRIADYQLRYAPPKVSPQPKRP